MAAERSAAETALTVEVEGTPYRFVKQLSGGAMGEVVLVEHVELGERRVMKLLRSNLAKVEDLALRMRTEARVLTKLDSPHVVRVHDFGRTLSGRPYLVMEALEGCTLKELVQTEGWRSAAQVKEIARQILLGLLQVHRLGIVHRDLKPDNVFYCRSKGDKGGAGVALVKILDFGIVRVVEDEVRAKLGHVAPTAEGMLVGTPAYLAPEQAIGVRVGQGADLYSTGAILWFLLVGRAPFQRETQLDLLRAHVMDAPTAPSAEVDAQRRADVTQLDAFILRALEKKPEDRFGSASEMLAALEALPTLEPSVVAPASAVGEALASPAVEATVPGLPVFTPGARPDTRPTMRMRDAQAAQAAQRSARGRSERAPSEPHGRANKTAHPYELRGAALTWVKVGIGVLALVAVALVIAILLQRMSR